jgi:hypothetical protein
MECWDATFLKYIYCSPAQFVYISMGPTRPTAPPPSECWPTATRHLQSHVFPAMAERYVMDWGPARQWSVSLTYLYRPVSPKLVVAYFDQSPTSACVQCVWFLTVYSRVFYAIPPTRNFMVFFYSRMFRILCGIAPNSPEFRVMDFDKIPRSSVIFGVWKFCISTTLREPAFIL